MGQDRRRDPGLTGKISSTNFRRGILAERDSQLSKYGQRNRHLIWITFVSLALDLLLTAALTVVAVQANHASGAASAVAQSDRNLCLSANVSRAQQVSLWNYILTFSQRPASSVERHGSPNSRHTCRSSSRRATALMSIRRAREHDGEISRFREFAS
jgi:hypothetical protein